jgi:predicted NBD/HSP70 family sugar kinase
MIVGVDIGATKTLLASFDSSGQVKSELKIPTQHSADQFLESLVDAIKKLVKDQQIEHLVIASRGEIDFESLTITDRKMLNWDKLEIGSRLKADLNPTNLRMVHDTHAAALFEHQSGAGKGFRTVLYITISTGIGIALTVDDKIVDFLIKSGGGDMVVGMNELGKRSIKNKWEDRVSGTAIKARFNKEPYDITDDNEWQIISRELALGINNCVVLFQPDIVVLGGGITNHFDSFSRELIDTLMQFNTSQYPMPPIVKASEVDRAVVLGTYNLVKK